jgi:hypothetical protein
LIVVRAAQPAAARHATSSSFSVAVTVQGFPMRQQLLYVHSHIPL